MDGWIDAYIYIYTHTYILVNESVSQQQGGIGARVLIPPGVGSPETCPAQDPGNAKKEGQGNEDPVYGPPNLYIYIYIYIYIYQHSEMYTQGHSKSL